MTAKTLEDLDRRRAEALQHEMRDPDYWEPVDEDDIRYIAAVRDSDAAAGLQVYREDDVNRLIRASLTALLHLIRGGFEPGLAEDVLRDWIWGVMESEGEDR